MQIATNMREAFINAKVSQGTSAAIINACAKAVQRNAGVMDFGKGWNARLSFKTAQQLKAEGILA
jgi:hypothetical protein